MFKLRNGPVETVTTLSFAWVSAKADETTWRIGPVCLDATLQFADGAPAHASLMGDRTGLAVSNSPPLYGQPISLETSAIKVEVAPNGLSVQRGSGDVFLSFFFVVQQNAKGFTIGELEGRSFNVAMGNVPPSEVVVSVPTADSPEAEAAASIPPAGSANPAGKDPLAIARSLPRTRRTPPSRSPIMIRSSWRTYSNNMSGEGCEVRFQRRPVPGTGLCR